ncbi:MAG: DUF5693 family protein [Bacillota bacterium]|jgi:hypothetical protein
MMKKPKRFEAVLWILLAVGLVTAVFIAGHRWSVEAESKNYDIVVDFSDFSQMSYQSEHNISEWLGYLSKRGVTKVALFETNIEALASNPKEEIWRYFTEDLTAEADWRDRFPADVVSLVEQSEYRSDLLVVCGEPAEFQWITDALDRRAEAIHYRTVTDGDTGYLWIYGCENGMTGEQWAEFSLGLWPEQVRVIEESGCQVIPRTKTRDGVNGAKFAADVFKTFAPYQSPYFMNSGDGVVGADDDNWAKPLAKYLKATGGAVAVTETSTEQGNIQWPGFQAFVQSVDYNAVRVFNAWDFVMRRYQAYDYEGPEEIINSLYRAIYERNCDVIFLKAIINDEKTKDDGSPSVYVTDPKAYGALVTGLEDRMAKYGYSFGTVEPLRPNHPSALLCFLLGVGETAAAVLLLTRFGQLKRKTMVILTALGFLCVAAALFVMPNTSRILLSIAGGALMPCLAATGLNRYMRETEAKEPSFGRLLGEILAVLLVLFAVAFCGSLFVASSLSDSAYILEMRLYRGVKVMQLLPLVVFIVSYLQIFFFERCVYGGASLSRGERKAAWNGYLDTLVRRRGVYHMILGGAVVCFIALLGVYYIIRTGNITQDMVPTLEITTRNWMEETFIARPRTKEFLIGYPCMALFVWALRRRVPGLPVVFGAGMVIGLTSIVNTFLHIRTGVALSLCRVLIGLGIGLVFAAAAVCAAELIYRAVRRTGVLSR